MSDDNMSNIDMLSEGDNDLFSEKEIESDVSDDDVYLEDDLFGSKNLDYQKAMAYLSIACPSLNNSTNNEYN